MLNSSKSKSQFFVLSAIAIVTISIILSKWIQPYTIPDTSYMAMKNEFHIFQNIKEKAAETVKISKNCEDLRFNLEEFKNFVENFCSERNLMINLTYNMENCEDEIRTVNFTMVMRSVNSYISDSFIADSNGLVQ